MSRVAWAIRRVCRLRKLPDLLYLLGREGHLQRVQVLFQVLHDPASVLHLIRPNASMTYGKLCSAWDRNDVVALCKQPRKRDLPCSSIVLLADPLEPIRDLQDVREVLFRVAWHDPPEVALLKVLRPFLWARSAAVLQGLGSAAFGRKLTYVPVMRPRPSGEYAMILIPSSRAALSSPIFGSSMSSVKGEYSTCSAEMGCTACARRRVCSETSDSPMYLTLPALKSNGQCHR